MVCLCFGAQLRRDKARDLLSRGWQPHMTAKKYDAEHALVLCHIHHYKQGLVYLYDKMRLPKEVLKVIIVIHLSSSLTAAIVHVCNGCAAFEGLFLVFPAVLPGAALVHCMLKCLGWRYLCIAVTCITQNYITCMLVASSCSAT